MTENRPTFEHLRSASLTPADVPPGTAFAHLLGRPIERTHAGMPITSAAAAIIAADQKAHRAQGGGK